MSEFEWISTAVPRQVVAVRMRTGDRLRLPELAGGFGVLAIAFDPGGDANAVLELEEALHAAGAHLVMGCGGPGADLWESGILAAVEGLRSPAEALEFYFGGTVLGLGMAVTQFVVLCLDGDDEDWRSVRGAVRDYLASHVDWRLHAAADAGRLDDVRQAIAAGWPLEEFDDSLAWTPLHQAVNAGHLEIAQMLLAAGVAVDRRCEERIGDTALALVADRCSVAMAQLLIDAGADPTVPGWMGLTALDRVRQRGDVDGDAVRRVLGA